MNLRMMANAATQTVNPNITVQWVANTGYTIVNYKQVPVTVTTPLKANVQALSGKDLIHADALNIQGVLRKAYLYGNIQGIVRADGKGGDILQFPQVPGGANYNWLVTTVLESWPDWCSVYVTLQQ